MANIAIPRKSFPPGIHGPSVTFFLDDARQEIDWPTQERHLEFMIKSGLHGIVIAGSSGESCALTLAEKSQLVKRTREIAQANGRQDFTITVGCWAGCTRDIIDQTVAAHQSGADFALVLVPSVFHWAQDESTIVGFFREVADHAPLPIVIYNCPIIVGGLDLNSDTLEKLSAHPNIFGVKLTCGGIGKMVRVAAQSSPSQFAVLAGSSDLLVPALVAGGVGCITGVANLFPKVLVEIYNLYVDGQVPAAIELQKKLAKPEWGMSNQNVNGMKWLIAKERGYPDTSAHCRRPFPVFSNPEKRAVMVKSIAPLLSVEEALVPRL